MTRTVILKDRIPQKNEKSRKGGFMKITIELLKEKGACASGIKWFEDHFPDGVELNEENIVKVKECDSNFVWWFYNNVQESELLYKLCGVNGSSSVDKSSGVNNSNSIKESDGVNNSSDVFFSDGVNNSSGVVLSKGVNKSSDVFFSNSVDGSNSVSWSNSVDGSNGVNKSNGVSGSFGILNCSGISHALFCANKPPQCSIFGKPVSMERFIEAKNQLYRLMGDWRPTYFILGEEDVEQLSTKQAWEGMPKKAIEYIQSLPEYDAEMFSIITEIQ